MTRLVCNGRQGHTAKVQVVEQLVQQVRVACFHLGRLYQVK